MRDYERAVDRLELLTRHFQPGDKANAIASALNIGIKNDAIEPGIIDAVRAVADLIRKDLPSYFASAIEVAREDVKEAAVRLQSAIESDLKSNIMKG